MTKISREERTRRIRETFKCLDCRTCTEVLREYFMVHNHVWLEAFPEASQWPKGMLCVGCLETRLGRTLSQVDFQLDLPINRCPNPYFRQSDRLKDRLTRSGG